MKKYVDATPISVEKGFYTNGGVAMRRTIDIPDDLDNLVQTEKKRPVHNGNASSVVRTALVFFFDHKHTQECGEGKAA